MLDGAPPTSLSRYDEFTKLIKSMDENTAIRARVVLSFYIHVAEGSGFYEKYPRNCC